MKIDNWDRLENKKLSSFDGAIFLTGLEIDKTEESGIFFLPINYHDQSKAVSYSVSVNRCVQIRSLATGQIFAQLVSDDPIMGAKFSPTDHRKILTFSWLSRKALLWNSPPRLDHSGEIIIRITIPAPSIDDAQYSVGSFFGTFSSDGEKIVFITNDLRIYIYATETGELLRTGHVLLSDEYPQSENEKTRPKAE